MNWALALNCSAVWLTRRPMISKERSGSRPIIATASNQDFTTRRTASGLAWMKAGVKPSVSTTHG